MTVYLINERKGTEKEYPNRAEAEEQREKLIELGMKPENVKIQPDNRPKSDEGAEVVETPEEDPRDVNPSEGATELLEASDHTDSGKNAEVVSPKELSKDPIGFLKSVNSDFVNTIKGKPAISKQGFRFVQREFGITTESEVVEMVNDPLGCVVWAKASLPDGHSAEAHGEGWKFEADVDDNEFVRYADTRAKNRALSDLTSAGALAVSELTKE